MDDFDEEDLFTPTASLNIFKNVSQVIEYIAMNVDHSIANLSYLTISIVPCPYFFFKYFQINQAKFEWENPDNIKPCRSTCGFLDPTLGSESNDNYQCIDVYICV